MTTITFERQKLEITDPFTATIAINSPVEIGANTYVPITIDNFAAPDQVIPTVALVAAATTLTTTVNGAFDNLKVGDLITGMTAGALTTLTDGTIADLVTVAGSKIAIYPSTLTSLTLPAKAGDGISGANIASGSKIDKIDYAKKLIYLTENALTTGVDDAAVSYTPRITAVRGSTWPVVLERNQVDINTSVITAAASSTVTFKSGVREALLGALKISAIGSTTNGNISLQVDGYKNSGRLVAPSNDGTGANNYAGYNYSNLGSLSLNADEFLVDAGVPRDTVGGPGFGS
jgi:hypothetical protein